MHKPIQPNPKSLMLRTGRSILSGGMSVIVDNPITGHAAAGENLSKELFARADKII
jgi:hypothetical protein